MISIAPETASATAPRARLIASLFLAVALLAGACTPTEEPETAPAEPEAAPTEPEIEPEPEPDAEPGLTPAEEARELQFRLDFVPAGYHAPFFYAAAEGYMEDEGIELEILDGTGSTATIEEVTAGAVDFGLAACASLASGVDDGRPIVSIAQYIGRMPWGFYVGEDSDIQSIADLEGRSIVVSPGSFEIIAMPPLFAQVGISQESIDLISVDSANKTPTYTRGEGDAVATTVTFADPIIQPQRPSRFLAWADEGFHFPSHCVIAHTDTVENEPELVQRFLDGLYAGVAAAREDVDGAVAAFVSDRPLAEEDVAKAQLETTLDYHFSENTEENPHGYHSPEDWGFALDVLSEHGGLEGPVDDHDLFYTNQFFAE